MSAPSPSSSASTTGRAIVSTRVVRAPRELVWRAWTEPAHLAQWWGPHGFRNTFHHFDLRPEGHWRFTMHAPDGSSFANDSIFREIVPGERLVFDHVSDHWFRATASLTDAPGGTQVTFRMEHRTVEDCDRVRAFVIPANEQNFDRLEATLARMAAPD